MIPLYTSYFAKTEQLVKNGILPVAISRSVPSWFTYPRFQQLAPDWETVKRIKNSDHTPADKEIYRGDYVSGKLLKHTNRIEALVTTLIYHTKYNREEYPNGIALLCYEKPDDFCHRHILAEFLNHMKPGIISEWKDPNAI